MSLTRSGLIILLLLLSSYSSNAASLSVLPEPGSLKGTSLEKRFSEISFHLEKQMQRLPSRIEKDQDLKASMLLYFLQDNLEEIRKTGIHCENQTEEIERAKLRNLPKGASSAELQLEHSIALRQMIRLICLNRK